MIEAEDNVQNISQPMVPQLDKVEHIIGESGEVVDGYNAPKLFVDFGRMVDPAAAHDYVEEELVRMAQQGTLSVTDIHQQSNTVCDLAGQIILGMRYDPDQKRFMPNTVVPELSDYRVRIRCTETNGRNYIEWRGDVTRGKRVRRNWGDDKRIIEAAYNVGVARFQRINKRDAWVSLQNAWHILHQAGRFCAFARRRTMQPSRWLYEEVLPGGRTFESVRGEDAAVTEVAGLDEPVRKGKR